MASCGQRPDNPAGPGRQLDDRAARSFGQGQVQGDVVAGVLGQVEVVQAGERLANRPGRFARLTRPQAPSGPLLRPAS